MYEGQLKAVLTSTYIGLITMQNMLAPLPDVMLHRLSLRDFDVAACSHHTVFHSLVLSTARNK